MHGVPGVMARVVNCLERENIPIYQTTDSHANISCLIKEEQLAQAVRALHREFNLDRNV
jgi:aspartate kinase